MNRDDAKVFIHAGLIAVGITLFAASQVRADQPVDCEQVRSLVNHHGKVAAYAWAIANGYRPKEIARIRRRCNV